MTATISIVEDNDTVVQYTSTGETTFAGTFPIADESEVKVSVDQVDKTLGADYSITLDSATGNFSVVFASATTAGQVISIWQDMVIDRQTQLATGAAVLTGTVLNAEFNKRVRAEQQLRRDIRRALRVPPDDTDDGQDMELPATTSRKGMYLAFDSSTGAPIPSSGTGADAGLRADLASTTGGLIGVLEEEVIKIKRTDGETTAGITPTLYFYVPGKRRPGDIRRYNAAVDGTTDDHTAIMDALDSEGVAYLPGFSKTASAVALLDSGLEVYGINQHLSGLITTANTINALEIGDGTNKVYRCKVHDLGLNCTAGTFGSTSTGLTITGNGGLALRNNCGPHHSFARILAQGFTHNIFIDDACFSAIFDTVWGHNGDTNWNFYGTNNIINMVLNNCYSSAAATREMSLRAVRSLVFNAMNFGSTGKPFLSVTVNSYAVRFIAPNFELDSGTFAAATDCVLVDSSQVILDAPKWQAPAAAAASAYLIAAQGTADVEVRNPKVLNAGANIIHRRTADSARLRIAGNNGALTTNSESSSVRTVDIDARVDAAPIATGTASVSSGSNIAHGLGFTPGSVTVDEVIADATTIKRRIIPTTVDGTNIKVRAIDTTLGTQDFGGPWNVVWRAYK